jgi:hypothetical protein
VEGGGVTAQEIQQRILLALGHGSTRLWRNNVGTGWAGQATKVTTGNLQAICATLRPGDVVIRHGRPLHAGLCVGSSDLIGLRSMVVNGQRIAQFVALEVKSAKGSASQEQAAFLSAVNGFGGCAGIVRSVGDAQALLTEP